MDTILKGGVKLSPDIIRAIILGVFILGITVFILKSLIKGIIVTIIIILLFRIGWVYSSDDLKDKFLLDKFINTKQVESIFSEYDNYVDKRRKNEVIDTEGIDSKIREEMNKKVNEYMDKQPDSLE